MAEATHMTQFPQFPPSPHTSHSIHGQVHLALPPKSVLNLSTSHHVLYEDHSGGHYLTPSLDLISPALTPNGPFSIQQPE